ncbi:MAG: T9SS type A sorting domain-containing protein [Fodinibius sp.]|nr:T9SS type A sorting domain-containing protein [Fodinibius sp.]
MVFNEEAKAGRDVSDVQRLQSLAGSEATLSFVGPRGKSLAFEGRNPERGLLRFALRPEIDESGEYIIRWPVWHDIPEHWEVRLRDGVTGDEVDMRAQNYWHFSIQTGSGDSLQNKGRGRTMLPKKLTTKQEEKARFRITVRTNGGMNSVEVPETFALEQNYPNPFNPSTSIPYALPRRAEVRITVYNVLGQRLRTLVDGERAAGSHEVQFDGSNLASGLYFYRIKVGSYSETRSMTLIK